jgi:multidrug resistance efflux pump
MELRDNFAVREAAFLE